MQPPAVAPTVDPAANGLAAKAAEGKDAKEVASSEARLRAILDACPDGLVVVGRKGFVTEINRTGLELLEAETTQELAALPLGAFICAEYHDAYVDFLEGLWRGEKGCLECECIGRQGKKRWVELHAAPVRDEQGGVMAFMGILRDLTARRDLEKQFIQAQKMEVVGQLAGGVAHDFNNMLGIIMGFSEMLLQSAAPGSHQHEDAMAVFHTAERAAALTRQILVFSRDRVPKMEAVDLGGTIVQMDRMLRRLIGENISLVTKPEPDLGLVKGDRVQIEQILMNLTVNARDAMPNGGTLTIETSNANVKEGDPEHAGVKPGKYSVLSVGDTGVGMTEEVKAKIFDAFYTTKPLGQGTGLGLSTCLSIVSQWHGHLMVESEPGTGAVFKVYLPSIAHTATVEKANEKSGPPPRGVETLLVVEDEAGLLALTAVVLERQGYSVLTAANGNEALSIAHERRVGAIHLVMTDMVMPEMGGRMTAAWLRAFDPGIKVLFTSGYTDIGHGGGVDEEMDFIAKPYTPSDLLYKVREVLDRAGTQLEVQPRRENAA